MSEPPPESRSRVSVVIVTRDRASVLGRCLESLERQSSQPDEVIIVAGDEASCPRELLDRHQALPVRLALCPERNICIARNTGLGIAQGPIVLFIDDDAIARPDWIDGYLRTFENRPHASAAGGIVLDAREEPMAPEFAHGLIHPSGRQIEVRDPDDAVPAGYLRSVKGCNFALNMAKIPRGLRFDPFFRFAFDETDLIVTLHGLGGEIADAPQAVVEHLHAPGLYRATSPYDRDWRTEFASHTMFMLKHTRGAGRLIGWGVLTGRFAKHAARMAHAATLGAHDHRRALDAITDAFSGVLFASRSRDTDRSSR